MEGTSAVGTGRESEPSRKGEVGIAVAGTEGAEVGIAMTGTVGAEVGIDVTGATGTGVEVNEVDPLHPTSARIARVPIKSEPTGRERLWSPGSFPNSITSRKCPKLDIDDGNTAV